MDNIEWMHNIVQMSKMSGADYHLFGNPPFESAKRAKATIDWRFVQQLSAAQLAPRCSFSQSKYSDGREAD